MIAWQILLPVRGLPVEHHLRPHPAELCIFGLQTSFLEHMIEQ
jgi:hypothetical protein